MLFIIVFAEKQKNRELDFVYKNNQQNQPIKSYKVT